MKNSAPNNSYDQFRKNAYILWSLYDTYEALDTSYRHIPLTSHDYYELNMHITGKVIYQVDAYSAELQPFDLLLIPPEVMHQPTFPNIHVPYKRLLLFISRQWFDKFSERQNGFSDPASCFHTGQTLLRLKSQAQSYAFRIFKDLIDLKGQDTFGSDLLCHTKILELLVFIRRCQSNNNFIPAFAQETDPMLSALNHFIDENLGNPISVEELGKMVYLSRTAFHQYFKKKYRISPHQYILQRKAAYARSLMSEGYPLEYVSSSCGYQDYSSFYRAFVSVFGISPREYLKLSETLMK